MTLAELLITMGLLTLVGVLVTTVAIVTLRVSAQAESRIEDSLQGSIGAAGVSRVLRTAVRPAQYSPLTCTDCTSPAAIAEAAPNRVRFYANLGDPSRPLNEVTIEHKPDPQNPGTWLLEQRTRVAYVSTTAYRFGCSTACITPQVRVLARGLTAKPVFTYYYSVSSADLFTPLTTVAGTNLEKITSIDLSLEVQTQPGVDDRPPREVITRIFLPNAQRSRGSA